MRAAMSQSWLQKGGMPGMPMGMPPSLRAWGAQKPGWSPCPEGPESSDSFLRAHVMSVLSPCTTCVQWAMCWQSSKNVL